MQRCFSLLLVLGCCLAFDAPAQTRNTQARFILSAEVAQPGETILAGVQLNMARGWHTYWRNAGESGAPTEIDWDLPQGITAGEIQWPVPEKYDFSGVTTYVYHGEIVLLVPLTIGTDVPPGAKELKAKVSWLECEEQCLPGRAEVRAKFVVGSESKRSADAARIEAAQKKLPRRGALDASAHWENAGEGDRRPLIIEWLPAVAAKNPDFFPFAYASFEVQPAVERLSGDNGKVRLRKWVKKYEGDWPAEIAGLLAGDLGLKDQPAYEVSLRIGGSASASGVAAGTAAIPRSPSEPWLKMILYAFIGGLILNFMPCVLPVIALKILGFVHQAHEEPREVRKLGLIYAVGVLCSFLLLAGLVLAVQAAGRLAGWGMQFQNPHFVVAMTVLVTLVALNLFGVFEITLGARTMDAAGQMTAKTGPVGAFFNGVLTTVLATPCVAPFLGLALGFALLQPPVAIVLMFSVIAMGLAFPYVLLSWFPNWLKFLPRPGAWMERFKIAMGFPMLATALWLLTLTTAHFGERGPLWVGWFLVALAIAAWIWGEFVQRGRRRKGFATAVAATIVVLAYVLTLERELNWRSSDQPVVAESSGKSSPDGIDWQPWSPEAVEQARATGRPVFVDFTASWCPNCHVNKRTSIEVPSVRKKLKEIDAIAFKADYSRFDERITRELRNFQRAGIPLNVVYPRDAGKPAIVLPATLTPGIVLDALDKAAK